MEKRFFWFLSVSNWTETVSSSSDVCVDLNRAVDLRVSIDIQKTDAFVTTFSSHPL